MDSNVRSPEAEELDPKLAFRKPSSDVANRKYRRRSPASNSSSPDGSPNHNHAPSLVHLRGGDVKVSENYCRRGAEKRELDRDSGRNPSNKSGDMHQSDKYSPRGSYHHSKRDEYSRHDRDVDGKDRKYQRSPLHSGRESSCGHHSDHRRAENEYSRSRDDSDRYSRHRYGSSGHRSKDKERDAPSYDTKERHAHGSEWHDGKKDSHRNSGDRTRSHDERRKYVESETKEKDIFRAPRDRYEDKIVSASENQGSHAKKMKLSSPEKFSETADAAEEKQPSISKSKTMSRDGALPEQSHSRQSGFSNDIDAAKVAAMKAAELVNKNLVGTGCLTTDQKKKLLWGNKKSTAAEESTHRWEAALVGDPDRQEKFNKLMGVKGSTNMEQKSNHQDQAEKQKELQHDLEKQYTAGLRRRDGRTVGLGL